MDDKKINNEQAEINELAKNYYFAVQEGDKAAKQRYWGLLYIKIMNGSGIYKSLKGKAARYNQSDDTIHDLLNELILKYDYEKNKNFCSFLNEMFEFKLRDQNKKQYSVRTVKNENGNDVKEKTLRNQTEYDENGNCQLDNFADTQEKGVEDKIEKKELTAEVRSMIVSPILGFWKHNKGRNANPTRYSYFRIFFTENIMDIIMDSKDTTGLNSAEVYDNTDKQLVKFVSFSEYDRIKDLLGIKFKKYSDVIENYDKEDKVIFVDSDNKFENIIIQKYRFRAGLDEKEVSLPNITQQRKRYEEYLRPFFSDYNR